MKVSDMTTQLSGTKQLKDCKCLLLTSFGSNHPLSHGALSSLFFRWPRPYLLSLLSRLRREKKQKSEFMGMLKVTVRIDTQRLQFQTS